MGGVDRGGHLALLTEFAAQSREPEPSTLRVILDAVALDGHRQGVDNDIRSDGSDPQI